MNKPEPYELHPDVVAAQSQLDQFRARANHLQVASKEVRDAMAVLEIAARYRLEAALRKALKTEHFPDGKNNEKDADAEEWKRRHDEAQERVPAAEKVLLAFRGGATQ
jgi:hypothetical protein